MKFPQISSCKHPSHFTDFLGILTYKCATTMCRFLMHFNIITNKSILVFFSKLTISFNSTSLNDFTCLFLRL